MALYEKESQNTAPTYTIAELQTAFQRLQEEHGNCTSVFRKYGIKIELCRVVKSFTKAIERMAVNLVKDTPLIAQSVWANTLYAQFLTAFDESRFADMFSELTQQQFNYILQRIIWWNPLPYDEERTFNEFVVGLVPGTVRSIPKPELKIERKTEVIASKPRKQRRRSKKTPS